MGTACAQTQTQSQSQPTDSGDNSLLELVQKRRSIRRYNNQPIDRQVIDNILKVALFAPSSYGQNPVEFVVVENKQMLAKLANCKRIGAPSVAVSAATVVVMADTSKGELWVEDSSVAAGYVLLATENYGIGACWNQIHLREGQKASASSEIKQLLGIPARYEVLCLISMGYKAEQKVPHTDKELDLQKVHFEAY